MIKGANLRLSATDAAQPAFNSFNRGLSAVRTSVVQTAALQRSWNAGLNSNRRMIQQVGFQVTDFATQIAGGQSAILAFTQQGGQLIQFFGPWGSIMAALLAIFGSLTLAITRSGISMNQFVPIFGVLQGQFSALGGAARSLGHVLIKIANLVVNNLDLMIVAASVTLGWFMTRWVAGMITAALTTGVFSNALRALALVYAMDGAAATVAAAGSMLFNAALVAIRATLMTLGIGLVIVAISVLITKFLALVKGAGSFGAALGLLKNVMVEVFQRGRDAVQAFGDLATGVYYSLEETVLRVMASISNAMTEGTRWVVAFVAAMSDTQNRGIQYWFDQIAHDAGNVSNNLNGATDAAKASAAAFSAASDGWHSAIAPLKSVKEITDAIAKGEGPPVDVSKWFGATTKGAKSAAKEVETAFDNMRKAVGESVLSGFTSIADGSKSLASATWSILKTIYTKIIDIMMTPIFNNIAGGITSLVSGGMAKVGLPFPTDMPTFAGGGTTWSAPRAGGVDGQGGQFAILHPDETVVDHRAGQSVGGIVVNFHVTTPDAASFQKSQAQIQTALATTLQRAQRNI